MKKNNCFLDRASAGLGILAMVLLCLICNRFKGSSTFDIKTDSALEKNIYFVQYDPQWGDQYLGKSDFTMASSGCLTTCIASALCLENTEVSGIYDLDPGKLNKYFSENNVYDMEGNIKWQSLEAALGKKVFWQEGGNTKMSDLNKLLQRGSYPIAKVKMKESAGFHYVLITKFENGEYWCMDPSNRDKQAVSLSDYGKKIYGVRYLVTDR